MEDMTNFARTLFSHWQQVKFSEVDLSDEKIWFNSTTLNTTLAALWRLLRSSLFAAVIVLRACLGRVLGNSSLADDSSEDEHYHLGGFC